MSAARLVITLDFWNTLYADTRELERERDAWRLRALDRAVGSRGARELNRAIRATREEWSRAWRSEARTLSAAELVACFCRALEVPQDAAASAAILRAFQEAACAVPPRPIGNAREAVLALCGRTRLAIVSDTSFTPGRMLREVMRRDGLLDCFTATIFSDEVGAAKPDPRGFRAALAALGAAPEQALHCGDLHETDIVGAQRLGMRAVLYRRGEPGPDREPAPHAVVADLLELTEMIEPGFPFPADRAL